MGGEGFRDVDFGEIQELMDTTPEEITTDELMETSVLEPVPDEEENAEGVPVNRLTSDNLTEGF